jgi:hypothetical protein
MQSSEGALKQFIFSTLFLLYYFIVHLTFTLFEHNGNFFSNDFISQLQQSEIILL